MLHFLRFALYVKYVVYHQSHLNSFVSLSLFLSKSFSSLERIVLFLQFKKNNFSSVVHNHRRIFLFSIVEQIVGA